MAPSILHLSNEILLLVGDTLLDADIAALTACDSVLSVIFTPVLHKRALQNHSNYTAMQWAGRYGHLSLIKLLLSKGIHPDAATSAGCSTALQLALYMFHKQELEIATLLLDAGADINHVCNKCLFWSPTALFSAVTRDECTLAKLLLDRGADPGQNSGSVSFLPYPLLAAVGLGLTSMVSLLCEYGAPLNSMTQGFCNSPLHLAVAFGILEMVRVLLSHGADVASRDSRGCDVINETAHRAMKSLTRCPRLVDIGVLLVQHGAAIEEEDLKPLECADKHGCFPEEHEECENLYEFWTSVARGVKEAKGVDGPAELHSAQSVA